jgi:hypothetical protein
MTKHGKIPYGSPEHILLEAAKADKKGLTPSVKLDPIYGGYGGINAVTISNLLILDKEDRDTLFGKPKVESSYPCTNCVHKDNTKIYEGDCIIPSNKAKEYFGIPKRVYLYSKIANKEVGHYCKYSKQITNDFAI